MVNQKEEFETRVLDIARVTRVAAGGRHFRFRVVVVAGDKKGKVGVGIGKGLNVVDAIRKATRKAKQNLLTLPLIEGTIPHEVQAKFGASQVLLKPKRKGQGLVAGGAARAICELAGIRNISAKFISKTRNKLNNALATMKALQQLKHAAPRT